MGAKPAKPLASQWRAIDAAPLEPRHAVTREAWINVSCLADGGVVAGSEQGELQAWEGGSGRCRGLRLSRHRAVINCARVLPDGDTLVAASTDKTMSVHSLSQGRTLRTLTQHTRKVHWLIPIPPAAPQPAGASPNAGWTLVSVGNDKTCKVWDVETWEVLREYTGHSAGGYAGALIDGVAGTVVTGDTGGGLHAWNARTGEALWSVPKAHAEWITGVCYLPASKRIVSVSADATVRFWDAPTGAAAGAAAHAAGRCTCVQLLDASCDLFATSSYNRNFAIWDGATMECIRVFDLFEKRLSAVALAPAVNWARAVVDGSSGVGGVGAGIVPAADAPTGHANQFTVHLMFGSLNLAPVQGAAVTLKRITGASERAQWDAIPAHGTPTTVDASSVDGFVNPLHIAAGVAGAVVLAAAVGGAVWYSKSGRATTTSASRVATQ